MDGDEHMTVLTYGTFDLFHYGHYNLLKRAAEMGDRLVVGISSDEMCENKGKVPVLPEDKRREIVSNLRFVDTTILEHNMAQKVNDAVLYHADIFVLGDDYRDIFPQMPEYEQLIGLGCKVVFLPRTLEVSTTQLKDKMYKQMQLDMNKSSIHAQTNK